MVAYSQEEEEEQDSELWCEVLRKCWYKRQKTAESSQSLLECVSEESKWVLERLSEAYTIIFKGFECLHTQYLIRKEKKTCKEFQSSTNKAEVTGTVSDFVINLH